MQENGPVDVPVNVEARLEGLKVITQAEKVAVTSKVSSYLKTISFSFTKSTSSKSTHVPWLLANSTLPTFLPSSASTMEALNQYLEIPKKETSQLPANDGFTQEGLMLGSEEG